MSALGILLNASSVGAKTVNGPGPFNVSTKPAAFNASASLFIPDAIAASTISGKNFTSTTVGF